MSARDYRPAAAVPIIGRLAGEQQRQQNAPQLRGDVAFDGQARVSRGVLASSATIRNVADVPWRQAFRTTLSLDASRWVEVVCGVVATVPGVPSHLGVALGSGPAPGGWTTLDRTVGVVSGGEFHARLVTVLLWPAGTFTFGVYVPDTATAVLGSITVLDAGRA